MFVSSISLTFLKASIVYILISDLPLKFKKCNEIFSLISFLNDEKLSTYSWYKIKTIQNKASISRCHSSRLYRLYSWLMDFTENPTLYCNRK